MTTATPRSESMTPNVSTRPTAHAAGAMPATRDTVTIRRMRPADGADVWRLVAADERLDANSAYHYLLWAREFSDTSVVAEGDGRVVGFATGFRPPDRPDCLFIWQVGVAPGARGEGLASKLLDAACAQAGNIRFLEATVDPANDASRALFSAFARRHDARLNEVAYLAESDFPGPGHAAEPLLRIGPVHLDPAQAMKAARGEVR